jgi:hypothetical protein
MADGSGLAAFVLRDATFGLWSTALGMCVIAIVFKVGLIGGVLGRETWI